MRGSALEDLPGISTYLSVSTLPDCEQKRTFEMNSYIVAFSHQVKELDVNVWTNWSRMPRTLK